MLSSCKSAQSLARTATQLVFVRGQKASTAKLPVVLLEVNSRTVDGIVENSKQADIAYCRTSEILERRVSKSTSLMGLHETTFTLVIKLSRCLRSLGTGIKSHQSQRRLGCLSCISRWSLDRQQRHYAEGALTCRAGGRSICQQRLASCAQCADNSASSTYPSSSSCLP